MGCDKTKALFLRSIAAFREMINERREYVIDVFSWPTVIRVRSSTRIARNDLSSDLHVLPFIFASLSPAGYYAFSSHTRKCGAEGYFYTLSNDHKIGGKTLALKATKPRIAPGNAHDLC